MFLDSGDDARVKEWSLGVDVSILNDASLVVGQFERKNHTTYRFYWVNVVLVIIGQGFDTFDCFFACKQLVETFNFAISNFLAKCTQIGDASIDLEK